MAKEITFLIEEASEGGYTASAIGAAIYTAGETLDEIKSEIKEAVCCHFNDAAMPDRIRMEYVYKMTNAE